MVRQNPIFYSKIERCDVPFGLPIEEENHLRKLGSSLKISHYKLNRNEE
jgi:hypothetical protein